MLFPTDAGYSTDVQPARVWRRNQPRKASTDTMVAVAEREHTGEVSLWAVEREKTF